MLYRLLDVVGYAEGAARISEVACSKQGALLLVVVSGSGKVLVRNRQHTLSVADILLVPSSGMLDIQAGQSNSLQVLLIRFDLLEEVKDRSGDENNFVRYRSVKPRWIEGSGLRMDGMRQALIMADRLHQLWTASDMQLEAQSVFSELLLLCKQAHDRGIPAVPVDWIKQVMNYVELNYNKPLSRSEVAGAIGVSPDYLSRRFKEETGAAYSSYVANTRVRKAKELLLGTQMSVQDVAAEVGFKDPHYLSRKFKQITGDAPSIYIRRPKTILSLEPVCTSMLLTLETPPLAGVIEPWMSKHFDILLQQHAVRTLYEEGSDKQQLVSSTKADIIIGYDSPELTDSYDRNTPYIPIDWRRTAWQEQFFQIADMVGKYQKATMWAQRYQERVMRSRELLKQHLNWNETFAVISFEHPDLAYGDVKILGPSFGRGSHVLYDSLQLMPPISIQRDVLYREGWLDVNISELYRYKADHICVIRDPHYAARSHPNTNYANNHPVWNDMLQHAKGVYEFHFEHHHFDPAATDVQLYQIVKRISEVLSTQ